MFAGCGPRNVRFVLKEDKREGGVLPESVLAKCEKFVASLESRLHLLERELNTKSGPPLSLPPSPLNKSNLSSLLPAGEQLPLLKEFICLKELAKNRFVFPQHPDSQGAYMGLGLHFEKRVFENNDPPTASQGARHQSAISENKGHNRRFLSVAYKHVVEQTFWKWRVRVVHFLEKEKLVRTDANGTLQLKKMHC
eukprot:g10719.t1